MKLVNTLFILVSIEDKILAGSHLFPIHRNLPKAAYGKAKENQEYDMEY